MSSNNGPIIVSKSLPFLLERSEKGTLVRTESSLTLDHILEALVLKNSGTWIGLSEVELQSGETIPDQIKTQFGLGSSQIVCVPLKGPEHEAFNECCEDSFWPVFHSMPSLANFKDHHWQSYRKVNDDLGNEVAVVLRKQQELSPEQEPIIMVHGFEVSLVAKTIRQVSEKENIPCKIVFINLGPFPSKSMLSILPWKEHVLQGILCSDLVVFQSSTDSANFVDCCDNLLQTRVDRNSLLIDHAGRSVNVQSMTLPALFDELECENLNMERTKLSEGVQVVLSVDYLDLSKGIFRLLQCFEHFLDFHPENRDKIIFKTIAIPARTQKDAILRKEVETLANRINEKYSKANWTPVQITFGQVTREDLMDSDIGMMTPLSESINLFAKLFAGSRSEENPGVLIVSSLSCTTALMPEALSANPFDAESVLTALLRALAMPKEERVVRMKALKSRELSFSVANWYEQILSSLISMEDKKLPALQVEDFDSYMKPFLNDKTAIALLLDYDGTLSPIVSHPDLAVLPPDTKKVLENLASRPDVFIAIVSGRPVNDVKSKVGIEGITYAGTHGFEILHPDGTWYHHPMPDSAESKASALRDKLQAETCSHGAWVEDKGTLLTYHYREVEVSQRPPLVARSHQLISEAGFKVGVAHCALEAKPKVFWDKGRASLFLLRNKFGDDWPKRVGAIFAGDDVTDEDALTALKGMSMTFRIVGKYFTQTSATKRLSSTGDVFKMLKWLEGHQLLQK